MIGFIVLELIHYMQEMVNNIIKKEHCGAEILINIDWLKFWKSFNDLLGCVTVCLVLGHFI